MDRSKIGRRDGGNEERGSRGGGGEGGSATIADLKHDTHYTPDTEQIINFSVSGSLDNEQNIFRVRFATCGKNHPVTKTILLQNRPVAKRNTTQPRPLKLKCKNNTYLKRTLVSILMSPNTLMHRTLLFCRSGLEQKIYSVPCRLDLGPLNLIWTTFLDVGLCETLHRLHLAWKI